MWNVSPSELRTSAMESTRRKEVVQETNVDGWHHCGAIALTVACITEGGYSIIRMSFVSCCSVRSNQRSLISVGAQGSDGCIVRVPFESTGHLRHTAT